ncbi:MAG TPA: folylpolyglutamate synthase/dihydrofolate synthase family protein [Bryobacteraceae bacterium]|nr:folylpolyglutamate synthase/dihydrofolate synthase family protein [Bryobacteraceae bacterium]
MNYPDSVHFLYALGNEIKTAKFGLERIRTLLAALGDPQDRCRFVHVAGTNGKGSTCAMIESGLRAAGRRTGLFISPHLQEPTERISLEGRPVSVERFTEAFNRVHAKVEELLDAGAIDLHSTYFETVTAMALLIFAEAPTDIIVLEVGLGGRLDATNVVRPELSVITQVDFDHEAFLGKSLESIAFEKAGILKPGVPAVFSRQRPEVRPVLERRAAEVSAPFTWTSGWAVSDLELDSRGSRFTLTGERTLRIRCPLAGEHQVENAVTAAVALVRVGVTDGAIRDGIARAQWPGRLELVSENPEIILDGAHNPAGARALAAYLDRFYSGRRIHLIYGAMRDKAVEEVCGILFPRAAQVIVTAPQQPRALYPQAVLQITDHADLQTAPALREALALLPNLGPEDAVFITGSLYLVGEARAMIGSKR